MRWPFSKEAKTDDAKVDEAEETVERFVEGYRKAQQKQHEIWMGGLGLRKIAKADPELYALVSGLKGAARGPIALALLRKAGAADRRDPFGVDTYVREDLVQLAGRLVASPGALDPAAFPEFVEAWLAASVYGPTYARIVCLAENLVAEHGMTAPIETTLRAVLEGIERPREWGGPTADERRQATRIRELIDPEGAAATRLPEPWQAPFREGSWAPLLGHAATAKSNAMSDRWAKAARPLLETVTPDRFLDAFGEAVETIGRMPGPVDALQSDMLRGLAWLAGLTGDSRAAALLGRLVVASAHKLPGIGARSQKGFSGAIGALERMGTFASLAALSNARNRIKAASLSAALTAALDRAAERQSLPLEELEELVVPTYGLELPGVRVERIGAVEARLEIVGSTDVELRWSSEGKPLKGPPAEVKREGAEALKELKSAAKEMAATLVAQRSRIEGLMQSGWTLPYAQWRERYLDHPLLAPMARRLVWRFAGAEGERLGMAPEGEPLDGAGKPLEGLGEGTTVRLWHPIHAGVAAIEVWREFLIAREIRQPFKQAYREIYLLTVAEERTNTYSNRFAAHVLKQHQMSALARGRGWRYALQGYFDSDDNPTLDLPQWGLQAEYFVDIVEMAALPDAERMTESGIAFYVVTDGLRFVDVAGAPVPLDEVPAVVLSETMRDVDLFVGVASVGNDPAWVDQGERTGYGAYWREVSFGGLSATAETRKAVLERLLPRLAIGKAARIEGKFLVVTGTRRTYKIHLGSGNILMEPNDQYLCIVPGAAKGAATDRVYLPFEGDGVLAIVLSKATMLANDERIIDPTILRQL